MVNFESEYDPDPGTHTSAPNGPEDTPPFPPEPTSKIDVSFIVPWVDGTQSVALVHGEELLDERLVSNNPPQVLITSPTGAETWNLGETHEVAWQGLDLDGDSLVYTLFYSNNGGAEWKGRRIEADAIAAARRGLAASFGSCSFDEPLRDLQQLGVL